MAAGPALGMEPAADFKQNCMSCHTVGGGRLVGPDLKNVTDRRDREWLNRFILNPKSVIDSGDAYAKKILQESGGVMMPTIPGLTPDRVKAILDLIEAESKLPKSQFSGAQISDRPFVPADIRHGREIFLGRQQLQNGGTACLSCHSVEGAGAMGGRLGPDLTKVFERLGGRKGLSSWLSSPATPTMQTLFAERPLTEEEILPLVAYFQDSAQKHSDVTAASSGRMELTGLGFGAAMIGLWATNRMWKRRLAGVRKPLVMATKVESVNGTHD